MFKDKHPMATIHDKRYECLVCKARIERILRLGVSDYSPNVHGEEWRCPNGHATEKVRII